MRILFDSRKKLHKDPFGTLTPGQECRLNVHVPTSVGAVRAECILCLDGRQEELYFSMDVADTKGAYDILSGTVVLEEAGL